MIVIIDTRNSNNSNDDGDSQRHIASNKITAIQRAIQIFNNEGASCFHIILSNDQDKHDFFLNIDFSQARIHYHTISVSGVVTDIIKQGLDNAPIYLLNSEMLFDQSFIRITSKQNSNVLYSQTIQDAEFLKDNNLQNLNNYLKLWDYILENEPSNLNTLPFLVLNNYEENISIRVVDNNLPNTGYFDYIQELSFDSEINQNIIFADTINMLTEECYYPLNQVARDYGAFSKESIILISSNEDSWSSFDSPSTTLKEKNFFHLSQEPTNSDKSIIINHIDKDSTKLVIIVLSKNTIALLDDILIKIDENSNLKCVIVADYTTVSDALETSRQLCLKSTNYLNIYNQRVKIYFDTFSIYHLSNLDRLNIVCGIITTCIDTIFRPDASKLAKNYAKHLYESIISFYDDFIHTRKRDELVFRIISSVAKINSLYGETPVSTYLKSIKAKESPSPEISQLVLSAFFWQYFALNIRCFQDNLDRKKYAASATMIRELFSINASTEFVSFFFFLCRCLMINAGVSDDFLSFAKNILKREVDTDKFYSFINKVPINFDNEQFLLVLDLPILDKYEKCRNSYVYKSVNQLNKAYYEHRKANVIKRIQHEKLALLQSFIQWCEINDVEYMLVGDSLLSCVSSAGYSRYFSNISITISRENYSKLTHLSAQSKADFEKNDISTMTYKDNPNCWFRELRLYRKNTIIVENSDFVFSDQSIGIYINIFPYDYYDKPESISSKIRYKIIHGIDNVIKYRLNTLSKKLGWRGALFASIFIFMSNNKLRLFQERLQKSKKDGKYLCYIYDGAGIENILPTKWFSKTKNLLFEDISVKVPAGYLELLKNRYDYSHEIHKHSLDLKNSVIKVVFRDGIKIEIENRSVHNVSAYKTRKISVMIFGSLKETLYKCVMFFYSRIRTFFAKTHTRVSGFFRSNGLCISENSKLLASYKDKYKGQRCFLIGNGPSLSPNDLDLIKDEVSFACNLIHNIYDQTAWRPTFTCLSDSTIARFMSKDIVENLGESTLLIREFANRYMKIKANNAVLLPYISTEHYKVKGNLLAYHYISHATVMSMMFEIAFYMGFKEIYMLGVDGSSSSKKGSHFVDHYFNKDMKKYADDVKRRVIKDYNPHKRAVFLQERSMKVYEQINQYAKRKNIAIYNATRGGQIEVFERKKLEDVII